MPLQQLWPVTQRAILKALDSAGGEAEQKAARKLGRSADEVAVIAHKLWGRSLTAERDRRAADAAGQEATPRQVQAARGHVTRALLAEIEAEVN